MRSAYGLGVHDAREPKVVTFEQAREVVLGLLDQRRPNGVIGISGPVGSGKSTLAEALSACVIRTDDYLPNYDEVPEHERDDPQKADLVSLARDLALLRSGQPAQTPIWCFQEHRRIGYRQTLPLGPIVCEGIHALNARIRPAIDVGVLVEAEAEERWRRWEAIEARGERGWGVERARAFFHAVAEPTFARFAAEYRQAADVIVLNPGPRTLGT